MKFKMNKTISLSLLLASFILLIVASVLIFKTYQSKNTNQNNNNCIGDKCNNKEDDTLKYKDLEIKRLCVQKIDDKNIKLEADIVNNNKVAIKDKEMYIHIYNDTAIIHKYNHIIRNLDVGGMITIKTEIPIEFENITKYELSFLGTTKQITTLKCY